MDYVDVAIEPVEEDSKQQKSYGSLLMIIFSNKMGYCLDLKNTNGIDRYIYT
jgi:hypothetical protein